MRVLARTDSAALQMMEGRPAHVWWCGERWDVIDEPTPTYGSLEHPMIMHPPTIVTAWRFTARNPQDDAYTFDFARHGMNWELTNVWD